MHVVSFPETNFHPLSCLHNRCGRQLVRQKCYLCNLALTRPIPRSLFNIALSFVRTQVSLKTCIVLRCCRRTQCYNPPHLRSKVASGRLAGRRTSRLLPLHILCCCTSIGSGSRSYDFSTTWYLFLCRWDSNLKASWVKVRFSLTIRSSEP